MNGPSATPSMGHHITPDSPVAMSIAKLGALLALVASVVGSGVAAYTHTITRLDAHEANIHRHLPEDFDQVHGAPQGHWDIVNLEKRLDEKRTVERAEDVATITKAFETAGRRRAR